jgi:hypothetical protein
MVLPLQEVLILPRHLEPRVPILQCRQRVAEGHLAVTTMTA